MHPIIPEFHTSGFTGSYDAANDINTITGIAYLPVSLFLNSEGCQLFSLLQVNAQVCWLQTQRALIKFLGSKNPEALYPCYKLSQQENLPDSYCCQSAPFLHPQPQDVRRQVYLLFLLSLART